MTKPYLNSDKYIESFITSIKPILDVKSKSIKVDLLKDLLQHISDFIPNFSIYNMLMPYELNHEVFVIKIISLDNPNKTLYLHVDTMKIKVSCEFDGGKMIMNTYINDTKLKSNVNPLNLILGIYIDN